MDAAKERKFCTKVA